MIDNKLPESRQEIATLFVVAVLAAVAALFRLIYGKDELSWRKTVGSMGVASVLGMGSYAITVHVLGDVSGYVSVAFGVCAGMFTDDLRQRLQKQVKTGGVISGND